MNKTIKLFILAAGLLSGCRYELDKKIISEETPSATLEDQKLSKMKIATARNASAGEKLCVVEVPCHEVELDQVLEPSHSRVQKFYDFCDSTVTIIGHTNDHGGSHLYSVRPIAQVCGDERKEKDMAYLKLQQKLAAK